MAVSIVVLLNTLTTRLQLGCSPVGTLEFVFSCLFHTPFGPGRLHRGRAWHCGYFVCRSDARRWPAEGKGAKVKKRKKEDETQSGFRMAVLQNT